MTEPTDLHEETAGGGFSGCDRGPMLDELEYMVGRLAFLATILENEPGDISKEEWNAMDNLKDASNRCFSAIAWLTMIEDRKHAVIMQRQAAKAHVEARRG